MIGLFKLLFVICVVQTPEEPAESPYVLQLQDDLELVERSLNGFKEAVDVVIQNQPRNLMDLLGLYIGFQGVRYYDSIQVPLLNGVEYLDCWSLPLVTLTTISISLPDIQNDRVDFLISVSKGFSYVKLVEESLSTTNDYVIIQKAARTLWLEVEVYNKWLGNELQNHTPGVMSAGQILQRFSNKAQNVRREVGVMDIHGSNERAICANSMYRITETILLLNQGNIDEVSQEDLFARLLSMISDIMAACLTNLPLVIAMKCHESVIEKREVSVLAAAQLLSETIEIITALNRRVIPNMNPEQLAFIENWRRADLNNPIP